MGRGEESKLRRRNKRKEDKAIADDMLSGTSTFGQAAAPTDLQGLDDEQQERNVQAPVEPDSSDDDDDVPKPISAKKAQKKRSDAAAAAAAAAKKPQGIKTMPLVLLILLTGTTLLPALLYAGDWMGNFMQKNNVMGGIGYRLGIGATPKKRVLSFYEKHDPTKLNEVDKILAKHYGKYPTLIKKLERKYQDYGYFLGWEQDEAPMTLAFEKVAETREYLVEQFYIHAPEPIKTAATNAQYNIGKLVKRFKKLWKRKIWPMLEPIVGVPKGGEAQKRKDKRDARERARAGGGGQRRKNKDFVEEEDE